MWLHATGIINTLIKQGNRRHHTAPRRQSGADKSVSMSRCHPCCFCWVWVCALFASSSWHALGLSANTTPFTKPEVHNIAQYRQSRAEPSRSCVTCTEKTWWRLDMQFLRHMRADRQTDRQTDWQTDRHTHHNTPLPYWERSIDVLIEPTCLTCFVSLQFELIDKKWTNKTENTIKWNCGCGNNSPWIVNKDNVIKKDSVPCGHVHWLRWFHYLTKSWAAC